MSHIEFLEKISEGLFIEGVNYRRPKSKHMKFDSYTTEQLAELVETSKHRCQRPRMEAPRQNMHHDFLFHPACYTIFHRGAQTFDELAVMTPPCTKTPAKTAGRSRGTKRRLVDSDSKDDAPES
mmetsp:Transcript_26163/g.79485  ORF Transcript_26163/g.79485 Transcript_26163/m.79485 type:complete len:124 (-) Transcript_26163:182-553(-)